VSYFGRLLHSEAAQEYSYSDVAKLAQTAIGPDRQGYRKEFVELVKDAEMLAKRTGILNKQPLPEVMDH